MLGERPRKPVIGRDGGRKLGAWVVVGMYVLRLAFYIAPEKTSDVERALERLRVLVEAAAGGQR